MKVDFGSRLDAALAEGRRRVDEIRAEVGYTEDDECPPDVIATYLEQLEAAVAGNVAAAVMSR